MDRADGLGRASADPEVILPVLGRYEVDFLVIGGVAVIVHGYPRNTFDLDILPAPGTENKVRLAGALRELDARAFDEEAREIPLDLSHPDGLAVGNLFLTTKAGAFDLVNGVRPDLKRYRALDSRSITVTMGDLSVKVIGRDDLIAMKREAGREQDLADIAALTEVERGGPSPASD